MVILSVLPNEILSIVVAHLERPRDVLHLALANRRLAEFVKLDGWKALLRGRFGLDGLDADARNAVHGLTTLYKNWERKALIARYVEPTKMVVSLNSWQVEPWRGPRGQTMGYQPKIDSFEQNLEGWSERKEILAWSAGTQIVIRQKETGKSAKLAMKDVEEYGYNGEEPWNWDAFRNCSSWYAYKIPDSSEGRDDITDLKLLRSHQCRQGANALIYGTASGHLSLLSWNAEDEETLVQPYETDGRPVGSLAVSESDQPLLATALGDAVGISSLALYRIGHNLDPEDPIQAASEVSPTILGAQNGRIWSCNFLGQDKVTVGLGPTYEPIQVYSITPDGLSKSPFRTFSLETKFWKGTRMENAMPRNTSIYPILAVPSTSQAGSYAGNIFLSGGYDGIIRLHDMRSPRGFETMFWDQTNDSSIYSLAAQGLERIVAGVSMHSMIKVFDLRFAGSHTYTSQTLKTKSTSRTNNHDQAYNAIVNKVRDDVATISGGWNLFLHPRTPPKRNAYRENHWRNSGDGPVYSLSIPSATSPSLYAGLEGTIESIEFHSIADRHPDTLHSASIKRFEGSGHIDVPSSFNPVGDALNLGMYEQGNEEGMGMQLLIQDGVTTGVVKNKHRRDAARSKSLDERWRDIRDESDRWSRGGLPQHQQMQSQRRGVGRGHGRGGSRGRSMPRGRGGH